MINRDTQLKLQAYVDHELSQRESEECAVWLARDPEARALCSELDEVKTLLCGNELEFKLPESREFYWFKIHRAISQEPAHKPAVSFFSKYRQWFLRIAPATGLVVLLVSAISVIKLSNAPSSMSYLHEIEMPLEDTSAISFYSQSAGMTVVWVKTDIY
jgi:anti-sigma factor RsiW